MNEKMKSLNNLFLLENLNFFARLFAVFLKIIYCFGKNEFELLLQSS